MIPVDGLASRAASNTPQCVLVSTGAFAPVHRGHVKMLESARAHLMAQGINVLAAYMSPSHDLYVGGKGVDVANLFAASCRCRMIDLATSSHPWLHCSRWESQGVSQFLDFPEVMQKHRKVIGEALPDTRVACFYVCGLDHALKCHLLSRPPTWCDGIVTMVRGDANSALVANARAAVSRHYNLFLAGDQSDACDRSSTAVRRALGDGDKQKLLELCHVDVVEYINAVQKGNEAVWNAEHKYRKEEEMRRTD